MYDSYPNEPDFEARITILCADEGGRTTPPRNGIRWDFGYSVDCPPDEIYMIWPLFLSDEGEPAPIGQVTTGVVNAYMYIVAKSAVEYHRRRLSIGTEFHCHEGRRIVAKGIVTKLREISKSR